MSNETNAIYTEMIKNFTEADYQLTATLNRIDECCESVCVSHLLTRKYPVIAMKSTSNGKIYFSHNGTINPFRMATQNENGTFNLYELTYEAYCAAGF